MVFSEEEEFDEGEGVSETEDLPGYLAEEDFE